MAALFHDMPGAIRESRRIAERCAFTLADLGYRFPEFPLPAGETAVGHLRTLTYAGARERYRAITPRIRAQLEHELGMIERLDLAGYFLIVWDIVRFARERGILCQGRGSAANSAVCYALGITAVDPIGMELLFERFLSEERGEWPDIDLDLPSGDRREEAIQYVYRRYGERGAAMTATVISYRTRSAVREAGKALGLSLAQVDRLAKLLRAHGYTDEHDELAAQLRAGGVDPEAPRIQLLVRIVRQMLGLPRHLGQHTGGMVIAAGLVVEVAIIRPGPIVGQMVNPYLKRRAGREPVRYAHPTLEPILRRTLGVPLFQEQLLRMAMTVAGFTGGEAEELRRAMGFKRSVKKMEAIETRLREGMRQRGIEGETADAIVRSITSFALYGFPESHAASFALLAYASAYLKAHHPAAFVCSLLNNQPMGFYHPFTLVKDAQRHGARFRPVDVTRSAGDCTLEEGCVRLGLRYVRGLRAEAGERIAAERRQRPFVSLQDFVDRAGLRRDEQRMLAEVGALNAFGLTRRSALWQVEKGGRPRGPLFKDAEPAASASPLPDMSLAERLGSDLLGTGLTTGPHPLALYREPLRERGVDRKSVG